MGKNSKSFDIFLERGDEKLIKAEIISLKRPVSCKNCNKIKVLNQKKLQVLFNQFFWTNLFEAVSHDSSQTRLQNIKG